MILQIEGIPQNASQSQVRRANRKGRPVTKATPIAMIRTLQVLVSRE